MHCACKNTSLALIGITEGTAEDLRKNKSVRPNVSQVFTTGLMNYLFYRGVLETTDVILIVFLVSD